MTIEEAIEKVERVKGLYAYESDYEALDMAIAALKKQIPVNPKHIDKNAEFDGNWKKVCPVCGRVLMERITTPEESYPIHYNMTEHCICGQKIYWPEDEFELWIEKLNLASETK